MSDLNFKQQTQIIIKFQVKLHHNLDISNLAHIETKAKNGNAVEIHKKIKKIKVKYKKVGRTHPLDGFLK